MTGRCNKSICHRPGCRYPVDSGMQCDECKGWYHEVCTNLTPAAFKRFSKNGCVWLCQQCCLDANSLLTEAISIVNAAKKCLGKRGRDTSVRTQSVDTQIDTRQAQVSPKNADPHSTKEEEHPPKRSNTTRNSRKKVSSVPRIKNGTQKGTSGSRNRKARSVSSAKDDPISQVVLTLPESHSTPDATVVTTPKNVGDWVRVVRKKRQNDVKGNHTPTKRVDKPRSDHSDRSVILHRVKESDNLEPKARFEHDIVLIKQLLNQVMPKNIPGVTLLKVYRLGNLAHLKPNQSRLLKVVFKSPNERDLILENGHKLKGSGVFLRKDLPC